MHNSSEKSRTQPFERHILYGLIALLCLAPLPFGGVPQAPFAIMIGFIGCLSIYWGIFASKDKAFVRISLNNVKWLALSMAVVMLWSVIQVIPNFAFSNEFWNTAKQLLPDENIKTYISVNPHESWLAIFKILSYAVLFWLTLQICRSGNNARKIFVALSLSSAAYAIYGLLLKAIGAKKVLWYDKIFYTDCLTSTFINRNNYATYAGIGLVISVALFLNKLFENSGHIKKRDFIRAISERLFGASLPSLVVVLVISSALILSASRAGIVSAALGVATFILLSSLTTHIRKHRKVFVYLALFIAILFGVIFSSGGDMATSRFGNLIRDSDERIHIYNTALSAISDYSMKGTGLGSFNDIAKAYRDAAMSPRYDTQMTNAHNSYLELLLELGVPVAIILFAVFAVIWLRCVYGSWERQKNGYIPAIAASTGALVGFHALFDFGAQIPAIAIIFIALLAIGLAQSWSRQTDFSDASDDIKVPTIYHTISTKSAIALGIILVLAGIWQFSTYFSENSQNSYNDSAREKIAQAKLEGVLTTKGTDLLASAEKDLKTRLSLSPIDSFSWTYLAYVKLLSSDDKKEVSRLFVTSIANGLYEPRLAFYRLLIIPVLWSSATDEEKDMFRNQIKISWKRDSKRTMQAMRSSLARELLHEQLLSISDSPAQIEEFNKLEKQLGN